MNVAIVTNNLELQGLGKSDILDSLRQATFSYGKRIRKAEVTLNDNCDVQGDNGVVCIIKVRINHLRTLVAKNIASNVKDAVNGSAMILRDKLERQVHKENKHFGNSAIAFSTQ